MQELLNKLKQEELNFQVSVRELENIVKTKFAELKELQKVHPEWFEGIDEYDLENDNPQTVFPSLYEPLTAESKGRHAAEVAKWNAFAQKIATKREEIVQAALADREV